MPFFPAEQALSQVDEVVMSVIRIAMWSGPRNISTALMRSFENRPDTWVTDEPFYGYYLAQTGYDHPGANDVMQSMLTNWRDIVKSLTGPIPDNKSVWYQKQMAHHLLDEVDTDWLAQADYVHVFLLREPSEMVISLAQVIENISIEQTGLPQQVRLFESIRTQTGQTPLVLNSRDILRDPRKWLSIVCDRAGIEFTEAMLRWPAGPRATDGVWARHWYAKVEKSTGFAAEATRSPSAVPARYAGLVEECRRLYQKLSQESQ